MLCRKPDIPQSLLTGIRIFRSIMYSGGSNGEKLKWSHPILHRITSFHGYRPLHISPFLLTSKFTCSSRSVFSESDAGSAATNLFNEKLCTVSINSF